MKKFLSMLLVLTMVVTTLMGVMVTDVNAVSFTRPKGANSDITLEFGGASVPMKLGAFTKFSIGNWYSGGYTYDAEAVKAWVAAGADANNPVAGTPTEKVNFLETAYVQNALEPITGEFTKYDFKGGTINDGTKVLHTALTVDERKAVFTYKTDGSVSSNYSRISAFPQKLTTLETKDNATTSYSWTAVPKADLLATNDAATAYKFTFYAYTQNISDGKGDEINFELRNFSGGNITVYIEDEYLVSENGIPHKVDLVLSSDGTNAFAHLYVDGVDTPAAIGGAAPNADSLSFQPRFNVDGLTGAAKIDISGTDWYITQFASTTAFTSVAQADLNNELIVVPNYTKTTQSKTLRTDDYITGVIDSLDADIKAVLETTTAGDKVVTIAEAKYNNPASLFDTTVEDATVKLVSRTTGEEVAVADTTGTTMDDYYFMVNGIYIIPEKQLPYYKVDKDPFVVTAEQHQTTVTRIHYENYEDNVMDEDLPALGGLRSGFLKYTSDPRGTFSFYKGGIKYGTNDGYYQISAPQISLADHGDLDKKLTLKFDMYVPEYVATGSDFVRITLAGHTDPTETGTNSGDLGIDMDAIYFTTNGLTGSGFKGKVVADLAGNAWNSVAIVFDSTDTATDGKYDISIYVNGELQKEYETAEGYIENAAQRLCSLNISRLYTPLYTSVGIMNDAWYAGDYTVEKTATAEGTIDSTKVSDVEVSVDNTNNLVIYDNTSDANYSDLISAMSAAGYQPVYTQVVDVDLVDEKYDEVDGLVKTTSNDDGTKTITGKLVKKWLDSPLTKAYVVADTSAEVSTYTIKNLNITAAVDNGDGTASITIKSAFSATASYNGIASTYEDIIAALAAENPPREGRTLELTGFAVVEEGKLPRIYSLQGMGTELYTLGYDETTKVANLDYREFGGTDNISFVFVVGAYDANGKMLALDVSEAMAIDSANEADGVKTKTFTADFGTLDLTTVNKYKVFAFNSLAERKPIMANYAMINPAYVAPVE